MMAVHHAVTTRNWDACPLFGFQRLVLSQGRRRKGLATSGTDGRLKRLPIQTKGNIRHGGKCRVRSTVGFHWGYGLRYGMRTGSGWPRRMAMITGVGCAKKEGIC